MRGRWEDLSNDNLVKDSQRGLTAVSGLERLFEPTCISEVTVRNRIVMSPMCTYLAGPDGSVTQPLVSYFEERAKGGVGLIITGYTFIDGESSRHPGNQIGIHCDRMIPQLNRLVERIQAHGAKIFVQINHYGRKMNGRPLEGDAPGEPMSLKKDMIQPVELSVKDVESVVNLYGKAAERAKLAGFDGVEIDGTPAGLINAFMLEQVNKRTDRYGGDLEGRMQFAKEVIHCVRHFVGEDFPVGFRFDVGDDLYFYGGRGITFSEGNEIAVLLEDFGVDYLNTARTMLPLYVKQTFRGAEIIKQRVKIPVIAVGSIIEPRMAERLLRSGKADLVALGRSLIADPEWPRKAKEGRYEDICRCIRCNDCLDRHRRYQILKCTVNVRVGSESDMQIVPATARKKTAVIGGGPAGMEASLTAALRGHVVTLFEKRSILGGNLLPASRPNFKADIRSLIDRFKRRMEASTVKVFLEKEATVETISEGEFDVVILAAGSKPKVLDIPVERRERVHAVTEVLSEPHQKELGEKVVVVGGGVTGCEIAVFIARKGRKVVVLEALSEILTDESVESNRLALAKMLEEAKVEVHTGADLKRITKEGLHFLDANGEEVLLPADSIVTAIGSEPNRGTLEDLKASVPEFYCVGDCVSPRKIYHAIHEGFEIGLRI